MIPPRIPLLLLVTGLLAAAELPADFGIDLDVERVLMPGNRPPQPVWFAVRRTAGRWDPVVGLSASFNSSFIEGRVAGAEIGPERIVLDLQFVNPSDAWVKGGYGELRVELTPGAEDRWQGTQRGFFEITEVNGPAHGRVLPVLPATRPPVAPREHPRLLLRREDLPALTARLATPYGQAAAAKMTNAPGLGLRYVLGGGRELADQAWVAVGKLMADSSSGDKCVRHRVWAWRAEAIAIAYDCCYDAWDETRRRQVEDYLAAVAARHWYDHGAFTEYIRWYVLDRTTPGLLYGPALAAIALDGEPGPEEPRPAAYLGGQDPAQPLPAAALPAGDLPVAPFASGTLPAVWSVLGGVKPAAGEDPLAALGGAARAVPVIGTPLTAGGVTAAFAALDPAKHLWEGKLDLTAIAAKQWFSDVYCFTVIDNDADRWVGFDAGFSDSIRNPRVYCSGTELRSGDVLRLGRGRHPLLVVAPIAETNPWGKIYAAPIFTAIDDATAATRLRPVLARNAYRQAAWQDGIDGQRATGGAAVHRRNLVLGRALMHAVVRHAVGDGGFQSAAAFPAYQLEGPVRYARCHATAYGRPSSPFPDLTEFLPRTVQAHLYPDAGKPWVQHLNGDSGFGVHDYMESRNNTAEFFACLQPISRPEFRPALLWAWRRHLGITGEADAAKTLVPLAGRGYGLDWAALDTLPVLAFTAYDPAAPDTPPAGVLPLSWYAPDLGYACHRNAFADGDDIVFQVFANALATNGNEPENAGAIRLAGFGQEWLPTVTGNERYREHVLQLGEIVHNEGARGQVLDRWEAADGSGGMTIDLADVYADAQRDDRGRSELYSGYGNLRYAEGFVDAGRPGLRAVAVDYSGASGAPCLLAVVDTVAGVTAAEWAIRFEAIVENYGKWKVKDDSGKILAGEKEIPGGTFGGKTGYTKGNLPLEYFVFERGKGVSETYQPKVDDRMVALDGRAFTLTKGAATLRGTFAAPAGVALRTGVESRVLPGRVGHSGGAYRKGSFSLVAAGGTTYFCVMTLQRAAPPPVAVTGEGLDAVVTVGGRSVRFDGRRIIFGAP
jgi:hypothetical protein